MNKFKAWLIRKLGGYVYLAQTQKIVFKEPPCTTLEFDVELPPTESESEKMKLVNRKAAKKIGRHIVDNGLCEITRTCDIARPDIEFNRERVRYKIRIVQPPKEHWYIDGVYYDPNEYLTSINFTDWMMANGENNHYKIQRSEKS